MHNPDRRQFLTRAAQIGLTASTAAAVSLSQTTGARAESKKPDNPQVAIFTKSFQDRPIPEVCRIFKELGVDGLDLTVRPGGHIDPKNVAEELPLAVQAAKDHGLKVLFLTTAITDDDAAARKILATAGRLRIDRIKMGYFRYDKLGTLAKQMDDVRRRISAVAKLAAKYNVLPCVHIHSGKFIPSHGTHLYQLLRDISPEEVGAYVDPLHMTKEGGGDGWRQGLDLLAPWIALSSMKNFAWERAGRDDTGQQQWRTLTVPVADGVAPIAQYIATLKQLGYRGIFSMHSEYKGGHSFKKLDTDGCIAQTAKDLAFVRQFL